MELKLIYVNCDHHVHGGALQIDQQAAESLRKDEKSETNEELFETIS